MKPNEFDQLLNNILQEDLQAEPLAGLEERVLQRIARKQPRASTPWALTWQIALALSLCVATLLLVPKAKSPGNAIHSRRQQQAIAVPPPVKSIPSSSHQPSFHPAAALPGNHRIVHPSIATEATIKEATIESGTSLPKLAVFPTPTQVSEPEHELTALTQSNTHITGLEAMSPRSKPEEPLSVKPITIASIQIEPLDPAPKEERPAQKEQK